MRKLTPEDKILLAQIIKTATIIGIASCASYKNHNLNWNEILSYLFQLETNLITKL